MSTQHTPGPWSADFDEHGGYDCMTGAWSITADRKVLAKLDLSFYGQRARRTKDEAADDYPVAVANARLIAAAPEMVDLLRDCADVLDNYSDVNDGEDGQPVANRAMSLLRDVEVMLGRIEGAQP